MRERININCSIDYLIVGGCPRSGTTMLNFLLNSHPSIFLANEHNLYASTRATEAFFKRERHVLSRKERQLSPREKAIGAYQNETIKATIRKEASQLKSLNTLFFSSLVGADSSGHDRVILGDKFPLYYRWDFDYLFSVYPNLKLIHITRSPFDAIHSNVFRAKMAKEGKDWFTPKHIDFYIQDWIDAWNFACSRSNARESFLHLCYENISENPAAAIEEISNFLGIDAAFDLSLIKRTGGGLEHFTDVHYQTIRKNIPEALLNWDMPLDQLVKSYPKLADTSRISTLRTKLERRSKWKMNVKNLIKRYGR